MSKKENIMAGLLMLTLLNRCCDQKEIPGLIEKLNSSIIRDRRQFSKDLTKCETKVCKAVPRLDEIL